MKTIIKKNNLGDSELASSARKKQINIFSFVSNLLDARKKKKITKSQNQEEGSMA